MPTSLLPETTQQDNRTQSAQLRRDQQGPLLRNLWYYALPSDALKPGKMIPKTIVGESIVFARNKAGQPFALQNICPHQGMPFHHGRVDQQGDLECCFHGWCFNETGTCSKIPSLVDEQSYDISKIRVKTYPCREVQGNIWIFIGEKTTNLPEVPRAPGIGETSCRQATNTVQVPCHIDLTVTALMDPAHVAFVHTAWWYNGSRTIYPKVKKFVPSELGYTMIRHKPSKNAAVFKAFGNLFQTEISFRLPGVRFEHITLGKHTLFTGMICLTPIDETQTEYNHIAYWTFPPISLLKPLILYFVHTFLMQDVVIAQHQQEGLKHNPKLIWTVPDAGTPVKWYQMLKKEWLESHAEGRPFSNPVEEQLLRWRS